MTDPKPLPMSFPRKRESMLRLKAKWIPAFAGMTIRKEVLPE